MCAWSKSWDLWWSRATRTPALPLAGGGRGSKIEGRLDLAQMIELGLGAVAHGILGRVGHVLLGILHRLGKLVSIELDEIDGRLGEDGEAPDSNLGEAAADEEAPVLAAGKRYVEQPRAERGEERRVMGENGHVAFAARNQHLRHFARDEQPLRRDQLELEGVGHLTRPRRRAARPWRQPPRWCRPCRRPIPAGGRSCRRKVP